MVQYGVLASRRGPGRRARDIPVVPGGDEHRLRVRGAGRPARPRPLDDVYEHGPRHPLDRGARLAHQREVHADDEGAAGRDGREPPGDRRVRRHGLREPCVGLRRGGGGRRPCRPDGEGGHGPFARHGVHRRRRDPRRAVAGRRRDGGPRDVRRRGQPLHLRPGAWAARAGSRRGRGRHARRARARCPQRGAPRVLRVVPFRAWRGGQASDRAAAGGRERHGHAGPRALRRRLHAGGRAQGDALRLLRRRAGRRAGRRPRALVGRRRPACGHRAPLRRRHGRGAEERLGALLGCGGRPRAHAERRPEDPLGRAHRQRPVGRDGYGHVHRRDGRAGLRRTAGRPARAGDGRHGPPVGRHRGEGADHGHAGRRLLRPGDALQTLAGHVQLHARPSGGLDGADGRRVRRPAGHRRIARRAGVSGRRRRLPDGRHLRRRLDPPDGLDGLRPELRDRGLRERIPWRGQHGAVLHRRRQCDADVQRRHALSGRRLFLARQPKVRDAVQREGHWRRAHRDELRRPGVRRRERLPWRDRGDVRRGCACRIRRRHARRGARGG